MRSSSKSSSPRPSSPPLKRIVATLTTIPSGVSGALEVANHLLGEPEISVIYLNWPEVFGKTGEKYPEPPILLNSRIKILRVVDKGPITKVYPVLDVELDPDTLIFIVDDDHLPERGIVKKFLKYSSLLDTSALTTGGWIKGSGMMSYQKFSDVMDRVHPVDWIEGSGGILVKRIMMGDSKELLDYSKVPKAFLKLFKKHDDHWLSWHLDARGVTLLSIPEFFGNTETKNQKNVNISGDWHFKKEVHQITDYLSEIGVYRLRTIPKATSVPELTKVSFLGIGLIFVAIALSSGTKVRK